MKESLLKPGKRKFVLLHLNILLFSFTSVFSKAASIQYNEGGLTNPMLYLFVGLMLLDCFIYAIAWQRVIRQFELHVAYANRSIYLLWSQIWAVAIFRENLSPGNIIGLLIVFIGVLVVTHD
ncbi:MAG: EamA-like transporter family protein [Lachnospiraceae bacterium]